MSFKSYGGRPLSVNQSHFNEFFKSAALLKFFLATKTTLMTFTCVNFYRFFIWKFLISFCDYASFEKRKLIVFNDLSFFNYLQTVLSLQKFLGFFLLTNIYKSSFLFFLESHLNFQLFLVRLPFNWFLLVQTCCLKLFSNRYKYKSFILLF